MARASGYSSLGFRASRAARLVRMAWGTYHTEYTVPKVRERSCWTGKSSRPKNAAPSASGWAWAKASMACSAAPQRTWGYRSSTWTVKGALGLAPIHTAAWTKWVRSPGSWAPSHRVSRARNCRRNPVTWEDRSPRPRAAVGRWSTMARLVVPRQGARPVLRVGDGLPGLFQQGCPGLGRLLGGLEGWALGGRCPGLFS